MEDAVGVEEGVADAILSQKAGIGRVEPAFRQPKAYRVLAEYAAIKIDSDGNLAAYGPRLTFH